MKVKTCSCCKEVKRVTEFHKDKNRKDGLQNQCKACSRAYKQSYRQTNRDKIAARMREYQRANPEKGRESSRKYREANRDKIAAYQREYYEANPDKAREYANRRRKTDPQYRITKNLRVRLNQALKGISKSARTLELLGCSIEEFLTHLEKQFQPGMTWSNYGKVWHVDHFIPFAKFDLTRPEHQQAVCNYTNLQPMFGAENLSKSDTVILCSKPVQISFGALCSSE